jgi:chromate reductase
MAAILAIDDSVRRLPAFDPDLEATPPDVAARFREACAAAPGVLIAVPEYAFGLPGAFKNALDWCVGSGSLSRKPVAVLDVSPPGRGRHAREALARVLQALDADVVHHPIPIHARALDPDGELRDPTVLDELRLVVAELASRSALKEAA